MLLEQIVVSIHMLSAAAWFGALVYRTFFVDPRAHQFFGRADQYEQYSLHLANRMRHVVMAALLTCGISGGILLGLRWTPAPGWLGLMGVKMALWLVSTGVFAYISWVFWPRRLFAVEAEYGSLRRKGLGLALTMIALAGLGMVLGQAGQVLRVVAG